jgi:hypothetical protein
MGIKKFLNYVMLSKGGDANIVGVNTTVSGIQPVLFFGDSNMAGRGEVRGPTPSLNQVYQWNGTSIIPITNTDIITAVVGSLGPQMGIDWNLKTGYKLCIIPRGSGGSNFYPDGDSTNWYTTGSLRSTCESNVTACLNYLGLTELRFIVRKLGINDARAARNNVVSLSNVQVGIDSQQTWIRSAFGDNVPLLTVNLGREENGVTSQVLSIRDMIEQEAIDNPKTYVAIREADYLQYYKADGLHLGQTGNNLEATSIVNFLLTNGL